ncbi:hypothetical protein Tsubulata_013302 [Turnera subulata]|uniref:SMP-30/Gluconolactonase/LRE-like region domain-containing protein n=1 Tax=Turnera subulata TaxID=218843 RepID=A0A9Q0G732_9ROSI|nr:hypothetical protein Tsubulata_013302 [Turnera subulata]
MAKLSIPSTITLFLLLLLLLIFVISISPVTAGGRHIIKFRSPNLYPEGLAYDRSAQHFLVGSLHHRTIHSVSDAGVIETFVSDPSLPENSTFLGLAVDSIHQRLLAVVHSLPPLPPFNALAAYDLRSRRRLFLAPLLSEDGGDNNNNRRPVANDLAVDFEGNAYVTNSLGYPEGNFIWKVTADGEASVFSRSPAFNHHPVDRGAPESYCGLNGIAYVSKGYFLVVQTNTGKLFKVDAEDGSARTVLLPEDLPLADGMAVRKDGTVVVVSQNKAWFLKSADSWSEGVVYDRVDLDTERFPTAAVVGREERVYVLYGSVMEGILGNGEGGREWFGIEEVRSEKESGEDDNAWVYVLVGLGLAYFMFWRFQMKQLVKNMDKKIN